VNHGAAARPLVLTITDAGNGGGTWQVALEAQSGTAGAMLQLPPQLSVPPGGDAFLTVAARATADAAAGDDYGFVVLRRGDVTRRIPYEFTVERPGLESVPAAKLQSFQVGDTRTGTSKVGVYRWPAAPFGQPASYVGPPVDETGAEKLYVTDLAQPAVNVGVAVVFQTPNSLIDPFFLSSRDENDVTGYPGTPVNVNGYLYHYRADVQAAGLQYPLQGQYYVAVDSGHDDFTGRPYVGQYVLHSWLNDVNAAMITRTVSAGRPTIVLRTLDLQSGVDPLSLVLAYGRVLVGAVAYDPVSGIAIFPLPASVPALKAGRTPIVIQIGDFQEDKNVDQAGEIETILPNTTFIGVGLKVVRRPTIEWLAPERNACAPARTPLLVVAGSPRKIRSVAFSVDGTRVGVDRRGKAGLYAGTWRRRGAPATYLLAAEVTDASGAKARASRAVKVCKKK